jgi:hypothetical protein
MYTEGTETQLHCCSVAAHSLNSGLKDPILLIVASGYHYALAKVSEKVGALKMTVGPGLLRLISKL